jgi:hypothetical protein
MYAPEPEVIEAVKPLYRGHDGRTYRCTGYDPRAGFWVETVDGGVFRRANVTERAIGSAFRRIRS